MRYSIKTIFLALNPSQYFGSGQAKPTLILIASTLIPVIHKYFGSIDFYLRNISQQNTAVASKFMFFNAFILMGIVPIIVIKCHFKESLKMYGLQLGNWKEGIKLVLILFIPICLFLLIPSSQTSEMVNFYPFDKNISSSFTSFIKYQIFRGIFFYTAWEFFFRGFLLFGLRPFVGTWISICIQVIPSCLWHIGLPTGEIFGSIAGGFLFGLLAIHTNSILWAFMLHYLIGIGLDFFIVITH